MSCKDVELNIPAYALDALSDEESQRVEQHLDECTWCSGQVRAHREVAATLALGVEQTPPPRRTLAALRRRLAGAPAEAPVPAPPIRRRPLSLIGAFVYAGALVALMLLGGVLAFTLRTSGQMEDLKGTNLTLTQQLADLRSDNSSLSSELRGLMAHNSEMGQQMSKLNDDTSGFTAEVVGLRTGNESLHQQMGDLAVTNQEFLGQVRAQWSIVYMLTMPNSRVVNMETSTPGGAQGNLMLNDDTRWCVLMVSGLNPPPSSHRFNLWLRRGEETIPAGALTTDDAGWGFALISPEGSIGDYHWLGITLDPDAPAAASEAAPSTDIKTAVGAGEVVMWGDLAAAGPLNPAGGGDAGATVHASPPP